MNPWTMGTQILLSVIATQGPVRDMRGFAIGVQRMMIPRVSIQGLGVDIWSDQDIVVDRDEGAGLRLELKRDLPIRTTTMDASRIRIKKRPLSIAPILSGQMMLKLVIIGSGDQQRLALRWLQVQEPEDSEML